VDFAPAFDFQSRSGNNNMLWMTKNIVCTGLTNGAAGFSTGWNSLKALNDRGALNAIVFFTDGQPNTLHIPLLPFRKTKKTSTEVMCSDKTDRPGVIGTHNLGGTNMAGIFKWAETRFPLPNNDASDWILIDSRNNCYFEDDFGNFAQDLDGIAPVANERDAFGNLLTGYKNVTRGANGMLAVTATNIENAGINALDSAASRARAEAQALGIELVTYAVGLASPTPAEHALMQRVANTKQSAIYDSTKPTGIYVYAEDSSELEHAFASLASDILRISK
jgi:hypothetical protein